MIWWEEWVGRGCVCVCVCVRACTWVMERDGQKGGREKKV